MPLTSVPTVPFFDWTGYYEHTLTQGNKPAGLALKSAYIDKSRGSALDLGSGMLAASLLFLGAGFRRVTAVDYDEKAAILSSALVEHKRGRFEFYQQFFHQFEFGAQRFDLIHADNSLPYAGEVHFEPVIEASLRSLKAGGLFAATFFGTKHVMLRFRNDVVTVSKDWAEKRFADMKGLHIIEESDDGRHYIEVICSKP
ncbi:MAG TPA: class I SAM-dependent methyltransferase [Candidatus Paceibacterota bacterium]